MIAVSPARIDANRRTVCAMALGGSKGVFKEILQAVIIAMTQCNDSGSSYGIERVQ